jgi:L-rhamnose-H+ transport protein
VDVNPFLGVLLHAVGGFAAASFYLPFKKVRNWSWESYWLVGGFFSWIIAPWVLAALTAPAVLSILAEAPPESLLWSYLFGVLWGIGGLTFGLSMRYLGMSLGYAVALGFCATFGTIIPPLFNREFVEMASRLSGQITLGGILVCLAGIALCGRAGMRKEGELSAEQKKAAVSEFSFVKGLWVAVFAGVMSSCMAFAFAAGKPIAEHAVASGAPDLFRNFPVLVVALAGGFTTNFIWCVVLNVRNRTGGDYVRGGVPLLANYLFAALAGVTWYLQFFFYGMGTTRMGKYDFSSWTIHMAFIIVFSNLWGIYFREWKGSSVRTHALIILGIVVLIASTVVVGVGNFVASLK